jgi:hypothetical protein
MQPPDDVSDIQLPPPATRADLRCFLFKRYKYVTLAFTSGEAGGEVTAFTLHQVEARKLVEMLDQAMREPIDMSFDVRNCGGVEGVYPGGPPDRARLMEFAGSEPAAERKG